MSSDLAQARRRLQPNPLARLLKVSVISSLVSLAMGLVLLLATSPELFMLSLLGPENRRVEAKLSSTGLGGVEGGALASWAESSVYVERTNALHPSRPSSFGPHITTAPLTGLLYPITAFFPTDSFACDPIPNVTAPVDPAPPAGWIALVQRGHCPFSQKVRYASAAGAVAVLFGDMAQEEGGVGGIGGGLLTPWSPDDTSDIDIPSAFVSRASYLSLLRTWDDEQHEGDEPLVGPKGLVVTLSKDEMFTWPLLDFLLLILFLPSLLTLLTVLSQRVRILRQQKRDRAPAEAVARLPIFLWGDTEKAADAPATTGADPAVRSQDEESAIGTSDLHSSDTATEASPLLRPVSPAPRGVLERARNAFPGLLGRRQSSGLARLEAKLARPMRHRPRFHTTECAICLSEFEKGERVAELPCGHVFHAEEICDWLLESRRLCPVCRMSITDEEGAAAAAGVPASPGVTSPTPTPASPTAIAAPASPDRLVHQRAGEGASPVASSSSVTLDSLVPEGGPAEEA